MTETLTDETEGTGGPSALSAGLGCALPCPFCGMEVDLEDHDTLYPSGTGWLFDEELQMRTYHRPTQVPNEQWCWGMHCSTCAGGCGAEIHGDSKAEALAKWNRRAPNALGNRRAAFGASGLTDGLCGNGSEVGAGGTAMKGKR